MRIRRDWSGWAVAPRPALWHDWVPPAAGCAAIVTLDRRQALKFAAAAGLALSLPTRAAEADFSAWLDDFKAEAVREGIKPETVEAAFAGVEPIARVLELDRRQPESTITFAAYIEHVVTKERVEAGRRHLAENRALLDPIGQRYQVQPRFIVALWAIESGFGAVMGNFDIVAALATLAFDGRRSAFFRRELIAALKILDQGHFRPGELKGSWAGAMGQTQFMPSSFLAYAVDYNGTGRQDIWGDRADVFASIANYLHACGWNGTQGWGRPVRLPKGFDQALLGGQVLRSVDAWRARGIRRADGGALPHLDIEAGLVQPGGAGGPTLMTYGNFRAIMKWNRSLYFASAVSYLADRFES